MEDNTSSSSSDEEVLVIIDHLPNPRRIHNNVSPFETLDNKEFIARYRLSKEAVVRLVHLIGNNLNHINQRGSPVTPLNQILVTLKYLATNSFQLVVGDGMTLHQSTVSRIIKRVVPLIALLREDFVHLPRNEQEVVEVKRAFFAIHGFPSVIGCVDGTHIKIQSPGGEAAELYRNRKGFFSYNVQITCDASLKICDIVARWRGSTHDATIFNASELCARLEAGEFRNCFLLGDNGYPCKRYLLTPVLNPATAAEQRYNSSHIRTRNTVERAIGVWKRRFPILSMGIRTCLDTTVAIIVACAVLHNIAIAENVPLPEDAVEVENNDGFIADVVENVPQNQANAVRGAIIDTVFQY